MLGVYSTKPDLSLYKMDPYNTSRLADFWDNPIIGGPFFSGVNLVYPTNHNVGAPELNLPTPPSKKEEEAQESKSGFFIFYNLNTDNTFFANIWIYIENLTTDEYSQLSALNNTIPRYD